MNLKLLSLGVIILLFALGGALVLLDRYASYQSPLYAADFGSTPRAEALAARAEARTAAAAQDGGNESSGDASSPEQLAEKGKEITLNKGQCMTCHRIGETGEGQLGPNLEGIGAAAGSRVADMTDIDYLAQSLYDPAAFVVEGFPPMMPPADGPPANLTDEEIRMVIAYMQSLGGTPTVTPETEIPTGR